MIYKRRMDKVFRRKYQRAKKGERKSEEREVRNQTKTCSIREGIRNIKPSKRE
jgi:hypothetical protein